MLSTEQYPRVNPRVVRLGDTEFVLRAMTAVDRPAIAQFAAALPPDDLLFLDRDIMNPEHLDEWFAAIETGDTATVLALAGDEIVGFGSLERSRLPWMHHVAEIRLLVAPRFRHRGLGRVLTREVFDIARRTHVEKVVAQMTIDQDDAIAVFSAFDFKREAVLAHHVRDREGNKHHLAIMGLSVIEFEAALDRMLSQPADAV